MNEDWLTHKALAVYHIDCVNRSNFVISSKMVMLVTTMKPTTVTWPRRKTRAPVNPCLIDDTMQKGKKGKQELKWKTNVQNSTCK